MQLKRECLTVSKRKTISEFFSWFITLGDGILGTSEKNPQSTRNIQIPKQYKIPYEKDELGKLIHFIYDAYTL